MLTDRPDTHCDGLVELVVERIGAQGDGIARHGNETIFLPFTAAGDHVRARLGASRAGGREGRVVERQVSGPGRADPPCRHFGICGGCLLQHLDPAVYREVKLAALRAALERAGIDGGIVAPLQMVPPARRRTRLGLARPRDPRGAPRIGFRERYRHHLVDLEQCLVLEAPLFAAAAKLRECAELLLPPGGRAEASLTRTDSGIDLLLQAAAQPALSALEALAGLAEECDLARVVWRSGRGDIPVVERRPVRVRRRGSLCPTRRAPSSRRARRRKGSWSKKLSPASAAAIRRSIYSPGSAPSR
jgi:23S rRNA (uracil1939-C5)-methyltransferase